MLLPRNSWVLSVFLFLTACGFRPLYVGQGTDDSISGRQLKQELASIFIDEIPDRLGQILRRTLTGRLTPDGERENPAYRLTVRLSPVSVVDQGLRQDSLATRYSMSYTAEYTLYDFTTKERILQGNVSARSTYDVQVSPYASDVAEEKAKERIMKILGEDVALRVATFLKGYDVSGKAE